MLTRPLATAALLVAAVTAVQAQETSRTSLRFSSGALIATGSQRNQIKDAQLSAVQVARKVGHGVAITGTFGWARSRDLATVDAPKLDVFTTDIGIEACSEEWFRTASTSLNTFAGIGGGARSYNYRKLDVDATNNLAGYIAAGGELGVRRVALRVEARDYATGFKPLVGAGKSAARNDVVIMATLRFNRRSSEAR